MQPIVVSAKKVWAYIRSLPPLYSAGGVVLVVAAAIGVHVALRPAPAPEAAAQVPHVQVASVGTLSSETGPLSVVGRVSSLHQATLLAQSSGGLVSLSKQIGSTVYAGEVIGQLENSSQRAVVIQAQGSYDAAIAARTATSLPEAAAQARNTYLTAYTTLDTTLHDDIDDFFGGPTVWGPDLLMSASEEESKQLSQGRADVRNKMNEWSGALSQAQTTDPLVLLTQAYDTVQYVSEFATTLAAAAHDSDSGATSAQLASISTARSDIAALLATISTARDSYRSKSTGATSAADASIEQARGVLAAANASLEKTIIRAPIAGTIVSLALHVGDYIAAGSATAVISNPGALEVDVYVTPDDAKTLSVGGAATIRGSASGVISFVAPAIDPTTNKIEVKVAITENQSTLTDGETVSVSLARAASAQEASAGPLTIPIIAVKITPQGPSVFTVSDAKLVSHAIALGSILGDRIVVLSGLTPEMNIVTDARGLSEGDTVVAAQ